MRDYESSHPWLTFKVDLSRAPHNLWVLLGECQSKIEHLAGVPLRPSTAEGLHKLYLAKGARATTAIEGNTLSEEEVLAHLDGELELPPSREYLKQEVANIVTACNGIRDELANGECPLCSVDRIKAFNRLVLRNLPLREGIQPGEVSSFTVGVARYRGAPRQDCEYLLERLCGWLNGEDFAPQGELNTAMAIIKAVLAHLYLAWLHPFGDGNGRTARLVEFDILLSAGVPAPAAHLLSNHYNLTREEYYRQLDRASRSGGDVVPFISYAAQGLRDGLAEQISLIRRQQSDVAWRNYVHESFRDKSGPAQQRRRHLVLDLSPSTEPVRRSQLTAISPRVAKAYAGTTSKTLSRDLNALQEMHLIVKVMVPDQVGGRTFEHVAYKANKELIDAFLPFRRHDDPMD